jgi:virginiamycin B lyase
MTVFGVRSWRLASAAGLLTWNVACAAPSYFDVASGAGPHDVAAAPTAGGPVYYTAQRTGKLGILDPRSGRYEEIPLGRGSAPHGVVVGPDGAPWVTDGGQNAIVRVDPKTHEVRKWPLPKDTGYTNLNTLTFDRKGRVWFTGQSGYYGRLDPATGDVKVWNAPRGTGPYGITTTPGGDVYYASLAGNHIARIDLDTGQAQVIEPPTKNQGARRIWSDSKGRLWVSYWNTGQVGMYDPASQSWREWKLPGTRMPIQSGSTTAIKCGSPNGAPMRSCASIRSPKNSTAFHRTATTPTSARCWAARARRGARSRAPTGW